MTPHSSYVWHHLHYRWHNMHSITPNHSIYDVTSTSGMTKHPSHPLYLCHHNLPTDITPTLLWHHTNYICDIICTLNNITFTPYVITLVYFWHCNLYICNHIQYEGWHTHYTCDITSTNLCLHTLFINKLTPTLCMTSHSAYVWRLLHYTRHHILTLWHLTTVFKTSHPLYVTSYPLYLCPHIHCIDDVTPNVLMRSHPLYMATSYAF